MYVQRTNGVVSGIFANPQPGYADEYLPDDDAEVLAYLNPPITKQQQIAAILAPYSHLGLTRAGVWSLVASGDLLALILNVDQSVVAEANKTYGIAKTLDAQITAIEYAP